MPALDSVQVAVEAIATLALSFVGWRIGSLEGTLREVRGDMAAGFRELRLYHLPGVGQREFKVRASDLEDAQGNGGGETEAT